MKNNKKWYHKVSSYFLILFFLIAFVILFISISILIKAKKYPDEIPDFMGYKPLIVLSGSMERKIFAGDLVIAKEVDPSTLKPNDIIAFRIEGDVTTTHRIVSIVTDNGETKFITKGDNNNINDEDMVSFSNVEGLYLFRIPYFGSIFMFIQKPLGLAVCLFGILIIGMIGIYFNSDKRLSKKELKEFEEYKKNKDNKNNSNM